MIGVLDEFGILSGTDKSCISHDYLRHYERIFGDRRDEPITLLEIGIARGASLRMWERYFSRATIVGVDINGAARGYATDRCIVEIGSQGDPHFLTQIASKYHPDIIIDDGSHRADHVIMTFDHLYSSLASGGIYIVEDVHFHSGPWAHEVRGDAKTTPQEFFLHLANLTVCPQDRERDPNAMPGIDSVEFFRGAVVIRKTAPQSQDRIAAMSRLVEQGSRNNPDLWSQLSGYALNLGRTDEALKFARRAVDADPSSLGVYNALSIALERTGDLDGAIAAMHEAVSKHPHVQMFAARLSELEKRG